jgi:hypothetical protein
MSTHLTRRAALARLLQLGAVTLAGRTAAHARSVVDGMQPTDRATFEQIMRRAEELALADEPLGEVIGSIGRMFLGTPYVAHTLEGEGPERLVVNLRGLDCLTLVENSLALARCVKRGRATMEEFQAELRLVRYRDGVLDGYPSRLHYFTDWLQNNGQKGVLRDITAELGGTPSMHPINFMSTHRESYRQMADDSVLGQIREAEERLSASARAVIPQESVAEILPKLRTGDILGLRSTIDGLDIAHTGIAVRINGTVRLLHASLSKGEVVLTRGSIAEYLERQHQQNGCVVGRPLEPEREPAEQSKP